MNRNYKFSPGQLTALCALVSLAPALRLIPSAAPALAGRAAWLSPLFSLPVLLPYVCFIGRFMEKRKSGEGLCELIYRGVGEKAGKPVLLLMLTWFIIYSSFILRSGADRIISTVYHDSAPAVFCIALALPGFLAAAGAAGTLVRTAKLIFPAVFSVLLLVLFFSLFSVDSSNLLPLTAQDFIPALKGTLPSVNVMAVSLYSICFIEGDCEKSRTRTALFAALALLMSLLFSLLSLTLTGNLGAELCTVLTRPFFSLVRNIVFFGRIERMEALVVSLWIFPDFLLLSVFLSASQQCLRILAGKSCRYSGEKLFDMSGGRWAIALCTAAALLFSFLFAPDCLSLGLWSDKLIPLINMIFAFIVLPLVYITGRAKKRL